MNKKLLISGIIVLFCSLLFFTLLSAQSWKSYLESNLKAWWAVNETSGITAYDWTGANNGTYQGNLPTPVSGMLNFSQDFPGDPDHINTSVSLTKEFSLSTWVNYDSVSAQMYFSAKGSTYQSFYFERRNDYVGDSNPDLDVRIQGTTTGWNSPAPYSWTPSAGTWYHLVATWNATHVKIYVNGSEVSSGVFSEDFQESPNILDVGRWVKDGYYFNGQMDEPAVWDRALNATEVSDVYNSHSATNPYQAPPPDTCTYGGSGNWEVDCSDNCSITSNVAGDGSNFLLSGTGHFYINGADVSGFSLYRISGNCEARCTNGCFRY